MTFMSTLTRFGAGGGGAIPDVTVATFSDLPTTRPDGYLVEVTAETGLSADTIVQWDNGAGVWLLVSTSCAYSVHSAVEWGASPGEWYDTGGITVLSADGARIYDTTYDTSWRWDETTAQFVPLDVYDGTIVLVGSIVGDSATPAGWTATDTDGAGVAQATTDGTKMTLSAVSSGAGTTLYVLGLSDTGLSATTPAYMKMLTQTVVTTGASANFSVAVAFVEDGARGPEFADSKGRKGGWISGGVGVAAQSAAQAEMRTAETLLQFYHLNGSFQVRVGAGPWQNISAASAASSANKRFGLYVYTDRASGTVTTTMTIRQLRAMRY